MVKKLAVILEPMSKMPALLMSPCNGRCCCFQCCTKLLTDCKQETSSSMTSALGCRLPCAFACSSKDCLSFSPLSWSLHASMTASNRVSVAVKMVVYDCTARVWVIPFALRRKSAAAVSVPMPLQAQHSHCRRQEASWPFMARKAELRPVRLIRQYT